MYSRPLGHVRHSHESDPRFARTTPHDDPVAAKSSHESLPRSPAESRQPVAPSRFTTTQLVAPRAVNDGQGGPDPHSRDLGHLSLWEGGEDNDNDGGGKCGFRSAECGFPPVLTTPCPLSGPLPQAEVAWQPVLANHPMPSSLPPLRLLDAAANRATEGLRVVEDYTRFVLDDGHLTAQIKQLRHDLAEACSELLGIDRYPARDTRHDVGTEIATESEGERVDALDVCQASLERTKQSLRSLEEYSKVNSPELSSDFEAMRYHFYTLEKAIAITDDNLSRLEGVSLAVLIDGQKTADAFSTLVTQLIEAGVGMIQLRDKKLSDRKLIQRITTLTTFAKLLVPQQPTFTIINDRADLAAVTDADGVHLGQDDLSVNEARAIVGPQKLIGVSTHNFSQACDAVLNGADYLGAGPTFPSKTKKFKTFPGLEFLQEVFAEITLPTFAIGGIDATNLPQVLDTGITRVAVSGAIAGAASPGETASELLELLRTPHS